MIWIVRDSNNWVYITQTKKDAIRYINNNKLTIVKFDTAYQQLNDYECTIEKADTYFNGA